MYLSPSKNPSLPYKNPSTLNKKNKNRTPDQYGLQDLQIINNTISSYRLKEIHTNTCRTFLAELIRTPDLLQIFSTEPRTVHPCLGILRIVYL